MRLHYHPVSPATAAALRAGGLDANGQPAERHVSDGQGNPCRVCLRAVPAGAEMLICALRPFGALQPYAETGPIFLCADECTPHDPATQPAVLTLSPDYLLKGYGRDERIVYGSGRITPQAEVAAHAAALLSRGDVAYVDVRSARNNCYLTRITRDDEHP